YEQESVQTRQDLARSVAHCRALEARVTVLETEARRHEWQRQAADDLAIQHIMRTQALEAGARIDTLEDIGTMTNDVGRYAMTWTDLKKKMTTKYCPRNEIKKIEAEMWNLKLTKHRWKDCPRWKNKNQGNGNAVARAYAVGVAAKPIPTTDVTVPVEMGTNVRHKLHGLVEEIPGRYDCAKRSFYHGAAPVSTGTLSIGPIRKERIAIPTRAFRQSFIKSLCSITMGSFILFVKKKDGSLRDVHRLSGTKQTNSEEPLSATKN
ncbi:hypothetical protein Tco_0483434, partial [Tanacetum coccineum]